MNLEEFNLCLHWLVKLCNKRCDPWRVGVSSLLVVFVKLSSDAAVQRKLRWAGI